MTQNALRGLFTPRKPKLKELDLSSNGVLNIRTVLLRSLTITYAYWNRSNTKGY